MHPNTKVNERTETSPSGEPVVILSLAGDVSATSKDALLGAHKSLPRSVKRVLLDFTKVDYINSSGLDVVIQMLLGAEKAGSQQIGIFGLSPHLEKVFRMVGIDKHASLYRDGAAALNAKVRA